MTKEVFFEDIGLTDYKKTWDYQTEIFEKTISQKIHNRNNPSESMPTTNHLIFCEHPHVYTLGKSGQEDHLLLNKEELKTNDISYYKINRGGDITYHGPGQIVGYPIFDLDHFFTDIHKFLRYIEEAVILTLEEYKIKGDRIDGLTGVWIDVDGENPRKICALGIKCSRWVTMHGFAFNVNTDLNLFDNIVPCGISDKAVTSMKKELGREINFQEVKNRLLINLANIFDFEPIVS
mgnify:CR=1 FL=1